MTQRRARRKPGENWQRLVQAGLHEFGLYGYHGTSTASIAARAEVPQPHVYANFDGKADLFLLCLDAAIASLTGSLSLNDSVEDVPRVEVGAGHAPHSPASNTPERELLVIQASALLADPVLGKPVLARLRKNGLLEEVSRGPIMAVAVEALIAEAGR